MTCGTWLPAWNKDNTTRPILQTVDDDPWLQRSANGEQDVKISGNHHGLLKNHSTFSSIVFPLAPHLVRGFLSLSCLISKGFIHWSAWISTIQETHDVYFTLGQPPYRTMDITRKNGNNRCSSAFRDGRKGWCGCVDRRHCRWWWWCNPERDKVEVKDWKAQ